MYVSWKLFFFNFRLSPEIAQFAAFCFPFRKRRSTEIRVLNIFIQQKQKEKYFSLISSPVDNIKKSEVRTINNIEITNFQVQMALILHATLPT
jgi:hypothetical protein